MIFSEQYGEKSFNIDVEERQKCMEAIFSNQDGFSVSGASPALESIKNLYDRYVDITNIFPSYEINDDIIPNFCDWLAEKVYFTEILVANSDDAHKIFVSMNDRGLSLTPTEMLKGYILSEIEDENRRNELNIIWKETVQALNDGEPNGDDTFIKIWLRSQYAQNIGKAKAESEKGDFERIGTAFHNWVNDEKTKVALSSARDYEQFVLKFQKFAGVYQVIRKAERIFAPQTRWVFYNAKVNFSFQAQLLLAPVCFDDDDSTIIRKISLTAQFIEFYILSRTFNGKSLTSDTIKYYIFELTKNIRHCTIDALKEKFSEIMNNSSRRPLSDVILNKSNKKYIKHFLARITSFIEEGSGVSSHYLEYMDTSSTNPYEIEHIIADDYSATRKDYSGYSDKPDFSFWRNKIGALLLLRKRINASIGSSPYEDKLRTYSDTEGNLYAASLSESAYHNNQGFLTFIEKNNLRFKPYAQFRKREIRERSDLLEQIVRLIWNPEMFD